MRTVHETTIIDTQGTREAKIVQHAASFTIQTRIKPLCGIDAIDWPWSIKHRVSTLKDAELYLYHIGG